MNDATWTGWLTEADAHEAFDVLRDKNGRRPCALEMKQNGPQRLYRLLFDKPRMLTAWCLMRIGMDDLIVPAYVALWERCD